MHGPWPRRRSRRGPPGPAAPRWSWVSPGAGLDTIRELGYPMAIISAKATSSAGTPGRPWWEALAVELTWECLMVVAIVMLVGCRELAIVAVSSFIHSEDEV